METCPDSPPSRHAKRQTIDAADARLRNDLFESSKSHERSRIFTVPTTFGLLTWLRRFGTRSWIGQDKFDNATEQRRRHGTVWSRCCSRCQTNAIRHRYSRHCCDFEIIRHAVWFYCRISMGLHDFENLPANALRRPPMDIKRLRPRRSRACPRLIVQMSVVVSVPLVAARGSTDVDSDHDPIGSRDHPDREIRARDRDRAGGRIASVDG